MRKLLSLIILVVAMGCASQALADPAAELGNNDGTPAVLKPDGTPQNLPPECQPGGQLYDYLNANSGLGYYKAKLRVESAMADYLPKPSAVYNCMQRIFSIFSTITSLTWPPNLSGLFSSFIDKLLNKACDKLWKAISSSAFVAKYNKLAGGYNDVANCTGNIASCKPIDKARARAESSTGLSFF